MPPGPTTCTFANTIKSRGFDFTFGPGVLPSVCMLYTVPHTESLPNVGELRFQTQGEPAFTFRDCLLEDPRLIAGEQGQQWVLPIKDRRWKWQFGHLYGHYNVPRPDGTYLRERTPSGLIGMCLQAVGETNWDASRIPDEPRPEILWQGDNPATELDRLCALLGCVVVLNPVTDFVEIWPIGEGKVLPNGPVRGASYSPVYPAQPHKIRVEGGPTLFQATFACEPVGLDTDGEWKHINQLSYRPAHGWTASPLTDYTEAQIPGAYVDVSSGRTLKKCDLATATVYRCYRISGLANNTWLVDHLVGTALEPRDLRDFRLFDELADETIGPDGGLRPPPAVVYARYWSDPKGTPATPKRYDKSFSFDSTNGVLSFGEPLIMFNATTQGGVQPAVVRYECAFHAGLDGQFHHDRIEKPTGSAIITPTRLVQRPEIQRRIIYRYSTDNAFTISDNLADTDARLNYWMNAALGEYGLQDGGTVNYQRLMPWSPDGLTQQITWSGGGGRPARTTISQAQRHNRYTAPLNEYRDRLAAKRAEQLAHNLAQTLALQSIARFIGGGVT